MERPFAVFRRRLAGFALVDLAVVVVCVGALAGVGVPRLAQSVERARAAEAFEYLASVRVAQERHQFRYGTYATDLADLDIKTSSPKYFTVPTSFAPVETASIRDSWTLTLTRTGPASGYGPYTVVYTDAGFNATDSTIAQGPARSEISPLTR